jgi:Fe-S-cluster-containing hydrogenase component 2
MLEILQKICDGKGELSDLDKLEKLAINIKKASLCGLGQTAPNPVLSTMRYFPDEYREHVVNKTCRAGECKALTQIKIDPKKCKGCDLCRKVCPVTAISGEPGKIHEIDQSKCIKCRTCLQKCPFKAIGG